MQNEDWQKIKTSLLSSGIPLEVSTFRKLSGHGYIDFGEYLFERNEKSWSIDIHALKFLETPFNSKTGQMELLIECKYCRPGRDWYFFKFDKSLYGIRRERPNHIFIDLPLKNIIWKNSKKNTMIDTYVEKIISEFLFYPDRQEDFISIASKGTEIIDGKIKIQKDKNDISKEEKFEEISISIPHALNQLKFGSTSFLIDSYKHLGTGMLDNLLFILIVPIIVTTAKLYFQKTSITLEEFLQFKNFNEAFEEIDYLLYHSPVDQELQEYLIKKYDTTGLKKHYRFARRYRDDSRFGAAMYQMNIPNCFYIVNYNKLDDFIKEFEKRIQSSLRNFLRNYNKIIEKENKNWF